MLISFKIKINKQMLIENEDRYQNKNISITSSLYKDQKIEIKKKKLT